MPYIIENNSGETIVIPDRGLNQDYSISLVGRNYENYGQIIAKTQIDLLENFASDNTPPERPTGGQLWYDKTYKQLRVYDNSTGAWLPTRAIINSVAPTNTYGQNKAGTLYYNTSTGQLYVHTGATGYQIANRIGEISTNFNTDSDLSNPEFYGTSIRNIFLTDTNGVKRSVLAIYYRNDGEVTGPGYYQGEEIIALFSAHDEFTANTSGAVSLTEGAEFDFGDQFSFSASPGGIGPVIRPGINTRVDYTGVTNISRLAYRAGAAYNLNTGSYSLGPDGTIIDGGANIAAANVFHNGADSVPGVTNTYDLGSSINIFAEGYIKDLFIGEQGGTGSIQPNGDSVVSIGITSNPIDYIYVDEITVSGNINFPSGGDIGDPGEPINHIYANTITVYDQLNIDGYSLPTAVGNNGDQIFLGSGGDSVWHAPYNRWSEIKSNDNTIEVDISDLVGTLTPGGTVSLQPQGINLRANVTTLKGEIISIASDTKSQASLSYDAATGKLSYIRTTPFDNLTPSGHFVLLTTNQIAEGQKTFVDKAKFADGIDVNDTVRFGQSAVYPAGSGVTTSDIVNTLTFTGGSGSIVFNADGGIVADDDITAFSDARLKENLNPIDNALPKVMQLTGYTYNKIGDTQRRTGVLAQDLLKVLPEAVHENEDGMLSVAYGNTIGLLVEAIKELTEEVNELKKQLGK